MKIRLTIAASLAAMMCAPAVAQTSASVVPYTWTTSNNAPQKITSRIAPPAGYTRLPCAADSYCHWLRNLPLQPEGSLVKYYNGRTKPGAGHHSVIDIDVGKRDLQQCADAVIRLKAEYLYARQDYTKIHFNYTSGDKISFDDWRRGKKPIVKGNKVSFTTPTSRMDNSYKNFKKYMISIFTYAGTASLEKELQRVSIKNVMPGDVFIHGGFPGHAMKVVDVAENRQGQRVFMLAQSYMPAQSIHIVKNPFHPGEGPWYEARFDNGGLATPNWIFYSGNLRRFKN